MDAKLAEIYGTNMDSYADLEKLAAAELAEKLAAEEGIDIDDLDDDTLEYLAQEVLDSEYSSYEDDSQEKVAEADYLGRVMAHSYWQELNNIEKTAAGELATLRNAYAANAHSKKNQQAIIDAAHDNALMDVANDASSKKRQAVLADQRRKRLREYVSSDANTKSHPWKRHGVKGAWDSAKRHGRRAVDWVKNNPRKAGAIGAGALAAGGGAAYLARKEKRSSALETLAEMRAQEMLAESGYDQVDAYDVLGDAVENRAMEMLAEAGYL